MGWWWRVLNEQLAGEGRKAFVVQLTVRYPGFGVLQPCLLTSARRTA